MPQMVSLPNLPSAEKEQNMSDDDWTDAEVEASINQAIHGMEDVSLAIQKQVQLATHIGNGTTKMSFKQMVLG